MVPIPEEMEGTVPAPEQAPAPETAPVQPEAQPPEVPAAPQPAPPQPPATPPSSEGGSDAIPDELAPHVQKLVIEAFESGNPAKYVEQASHAESAATIDALEAALAQPDIYQRLVRDGKLPPAP